MLTLALATLALAAPPSVTCTEVTLQIPAPELEIKLPKGFAWEGPAPLAALRDGRILLARHAALGGISTKTLARQQRQALNLGERADSPWRLTQILTVAPSGEVIGGPVIDRGNQLEIAQLPGGPVVLAHRVRETTSLLVFSDDGAEVVRKIALPDAIQYDIKWRDRNPVKGTGIARLHPIDATRVVHAYDGVANVIDVSTGVVSDDVAFRTNQMAVVRGPDGSEVFALEDGDRLLRLGADLKILDQRECVGCQIVPFTGVEPGTDAAALVRPVPGGIRVAFLRTGQSLAELPGGVDLPIPQAIAGEEIGWSVRPGPPGAVLVALTGLGQELARFAYAFGPGREAPTWTYTAPEVGGRGELLVADAVQGQVRLRLVLTDGKLEETSHAALLDPGTGRATDWLAIPKASADLRPSLSDLGAPAAHGVHSGLVPAQDPMLERAPHGPSSASFRRCALDPAAP